MNFNEKIIVGMSGGVDSSISAIILKDMGFNIKGLFMKNWEEDDHDGNCNAKFLSLYVDQLYSRINHYASPIPCYHHQQSFQVYL